MFNYSKFSTLEAAIKYGKSQGLKNTHIELLTYIYNKFKTLAFCPRWIKQAPNRICLSKLISTNIIKEYPPICDIPESFIAQPILELSTVPIFDKSRLADRHVDLRPFSLVGHKKFKLVSGALTRVALKKNSLIVNSSQGGGVKDTWVMTE